MRRLALVALGCAAVLGPAAAQETPPRDARELLAWHASTSEAEQATVDDLCWQAYVYLTAGAEGELRDRLARIEAQGGADDPEVAADVQRFAIQAACWSPERHAKGLAMAEAWEARFGDGPAPAVAAVADMRRFLEGRLAREEAAHLRSVGMLWYPLLVLLALVALGRWLWRGWR